MNHESNRVKTEFLKNGKSVFWEKQEGSKAFEKLARKWKEAKFPIYLNNSSIVVYQSIKECFKKNLEWQNSF